ncbi:DBH-like monooxygenase protein 2 homolog [Amphiprion ocellaris]|uniref:DOMON domain-containing protein n=1 Tax=Amphiprion ocellaris TaxID=80972 RepID=A0A3Q1B4T3_AMPOC|nr:DBH-like monooxygenase protein 2 homolog [Amphiprion ocellaris]
MCSLPPLLPLLLAWATVAGATDPTLPFMEYLDRDRLVCLKWGFDNLQGNITFQLVVNSTGWVGFGLSPNGGMKGSDIIIGGLGPSGSYFTDLHATGNSMPLVDDQQNYALLSMSETDGQTTMTFQRSIKACDDKDFHITAQPIKLIYAYGTTDEINYHGNRRGTKEVNLLNYMPRTIPTDSNYLIAKVDNFTVPSTLTYYHCKIMKFPKLNTKIHIYQIEPVIENHDLIHHMLLYKCPPDVTEPYENQCYVGDIGDNCFNPVASWGIGGGVFEFPENAGVPFGGEDNDPFYRLEIHYNNPEIKAGITDSSGLRLHYSAQLRQHDVGILTTGVLIRSNLPYNIPPKTSQFRTYGTCDTSQFSVHMNPVPDISVFAVLLHTHLAGRKVRVGHFRGGKQIDFLGLDENYNFELQQTVNLGNIKTIKPGDEIVVECTYNTTDRDGITKMDLATTDEMCVAFLFYYPANNVTYCGSRPNTTFLPTINVNDIASDEYETLLKNQPQFQVVIDYANRPSILKNVTLRQMMKTPTVACQKYNASSRLCASWIVNRAVMLLLFLWIAVV